jgi:soluble lytic murein transglycosylase-like protein
VSKYPLWDAEKVVSIAFCESSFRPQVVNNNPISGDYSVGLMQINIIGSLAKDRPKEEELKDPEKNIDFAYTLWQQQGYGAWRNCL